MLMGDLLDHPLTTEEIIEVQRSNLICDKLIDDTMIQNASISAFLKDKIANLLSQGMKFGIELDKLTKRGIYIKFINAIQNYTCIDRQYHNIPVFLFMVGNEAILQSSDIKIVYTYADFQKYKSNKTLFVVDRELTKLLAFDDIAYALEKGSLLMITNVYHNKATIQVVHKQNMRKRKVFISGSRTQTVITENIHASLKAIMEQNIEILIGDSDKGVDNEVIDYLRGIYLHVEIFTMKAKPRVNVEKEWKLRFINTEPTLNPQEKQMVKDRVMAEEADWGLAVFKPISINRYGAVQVSSGTLRNTLQMLLHKKAVKFFYVYENQITYKNLKTLDDLENLLTLYQTEKLSPSEIEELSSANGIKENMDLSQEKYKKIYKKYKELLTKEQELYTKNSDDKLKQISLF